MLNAEFRNQTGEQNELMCLCALELHTGRRLELFFDRVYEKPLDYNGDLFVYCVASAVLTTGSIVVFMSELAVALQPTLLRTVEHYGRFGQKMSRDDAEYLFV